MDPVLMMRESEQAWYCARTQPKHEHIAARNLRCRLGLEVFNPRLSVERATSRGLVKLLEPLFPCYIFVRCQLADRLDDIRYTNGVSSLVHFGCQIPQVPEGVVEELRRCFELDEVMNVEDQFTPGSQVSVVDGPFLGIHATVVRALRARQRVQILLEFLGRTTLTEVDRKSLTPVGRNMADLIPTLASERLSAASAA